MKVTESSAAQPHRMSYLERLESEAIHILREAVAADPAHCGECNP